jgi:two-component system sensor histidine kinase TctE
LQFEANPILIKELVRNLLENAINYTPSEPSKPGVINLSVRVDVKAQHLMFTIEDSGPGISKADKELVFQPFYRTLGVTGQIEGSGLGLSIVKEIADQHQAEVILEDVQEEQVQEAVLTGTSKARGLRVRVVFPLKKSSSMR